jgi:hypothetical protein
MAELAALALHYYHAAVLLADGSARFVSESIDRTMWRALATIGGGEVIGQF